MNTDVLYQATAFVWQEADMLDHGEYADWLGLWTETGTYIIPIDPDAANFEDTLNYAYDNAEMRRLRVQRLTGGESVSTTPPPRTVRGVSRLRVLGEHDGIVTLRGAQDLREFRKTTLRQHTADITWELQRAGSSFRLHRKVVRLINSTDALSSIAYIL